MSAISGTCNPGRKILELVFKICSFAQAKQNITSNNNGIYELLNELPNNLRPTQENLKTTCNYSVVLSS